MGQVLDRLFPSMFQRRLVLLLALMALVMLLLSAKLGHLALVEGERLADEARANLVRTRWTPTVRGSITDRKGRVLATDRAAYDIAIGYPMIAWTWAEERARLFVRRFYREQWADFSESQRRELVERAVPAYLVHLHRAWEDLGALTQVPRAELEARAQKIHEGVERMRAHLAEVTKDEQRKAAGRRGEAVTPEMERAIERRAGRPIAEMRASHRILQRVSDPIAFEVQFLVGEVVDLVPLPGERGVRSVDRVERIPGLAVFDTGDREYPCESMTVEIDRSGFPSPVGAEGRVEFTVRGVASHVIGHLRDKVHLEDNRGTLDKATGERRGGRAQFLEENPEAKRAAVIDIGRGHLADRGEYRQGDRVGNAGVEEGYEHQLRGLRGLVTRHADTGETTILPAVSGRNIVLTLDAGLQARIQAVMSPEMGLARVQPWHRTSSEPPNPTMPDGTAIHGAAVVLDIDSGDVLAMVSMPEVTREERLSDWDDLGAYFRDPVSAPLINRALARGYPPGSIAKPLVLCGAQQHGDYSPGQRIGCTGHLMPGNPNLFRCWIFKRTQASGDPQTHANVFGRDLSAREALMVSCNIFFYTLGQRLGPEGIVDVYRQMGVGRGFGLHAGEEHRGRLGRKGDGSDLGIGDAIQMGIGQGPVTWTPLHAAAAYATLARYGFAIPPRLVKDERAPEAIDLKLDARVVQEALEGLHLSVNDDSGTGHHLTLGDERRHEPIFNAPGVEIWGKTGTAEASRILAPPAEDTEAASPDHDGENPSPAAPARPEVLRAGDHSWFVVLVGKEGDRPRYAISVIMEYAGSGGRVSGPIANQIIHALIAEGYL